MKPKNKKYRIDRLEVLNMVKKFNRENFVSMKPTVSTDKKKKANKKHCRNKQDDDQ